MNLDSAIVYKKYFDGKKVDEVHSSMQDHLLSKKSSYDDAQPIFRGLVEGLSALEGIDLCCCGDDKGGQVVCFKYDGESVIYINLASEVPEGQRPGGLRELSVIVGENVSNNNLHSITGVVESALVYAGSSERGDLRVPREDFF
jgi:hypothetical protein